MPFLKEVAGPEFMDAVTSMVRERISLPVPVRTQMLQYLQNWRYLAEAHPQDLGYMASAVRALETEHGITLPSAEAHVVAAAQALTDTLIAPDWTDSSVCTRCRADFGTFLRKHHCRNCGRVFCYKCSSKTMALPWYSIKEPVRVCDGCFKRKGPIPASKTAVPRTEASASNTTSKEDDDLARAIALSLQESSRPTEPSIERRKAEGTDADDDPELAAAIAASLREWEASSQPPPPPTSNTPSVPIPAPTATFTTPPPAVPTSSPTPMALQTRTQRPLQMDASDYDHILTFYQTVKTSSAPWKERVPTDGVPVPVQNMHTKAAASRAKLARHLDVGHRRLRELTQLHETLTDVVRLYDRLLDAQWETPPVSQRPTHPNAQDEWHTVPSAPPSLAAPTMLPSAPMDADGRVPATHTTHVSSHTPPADPASEALLIDL